MLSDVYITGSDIKNYIYCPRIIYFKRVMCVEPILGKQQSYGKLRHIKEIFNESRRKGSYKGISSKRKLFNYRIVSDRLSASAVIDCVIENEDGSFVIIEYKNSISNNGKVYSDHKYQLTFYALLLEDVVKQTIDKGFINYLQDNKVVKVEITGSMKKYVSRLILLIKNDIEKEKLRPIQVNRKKCYGCGYMHICYGY